MRVLVLASLLALLALAAAQTASIDQLAAYKNSTGGVVPVLTLSSGSPVQFNDAHTALNIDLLKNQYALETLTHLVSERIPERIVYAKAAGAFGYFKATHDITDLTKAKIFSEIGKAIPVAVRFAPIAPPRGGSDIEGASRGFSIKFYTEEGNWDLVGSHTPVFAIRDPIKFASFVHAIKKNPVTDLVDFNMTWDFITRNPESFFIYLLSISPYGVPNGYRYMMGNSVHTYQLANVRNQTTFARFYLYPSLGVQNLTAGSTTDPDYFVRDLYNSIGNATYPSWNVYLQPITLKQVLKARARGVDVFDVTRTLSTKKYPLRPVGKLILKRNPASYFAEVEQLAFSPGNVVPGIVGAPDTMYVARTFAYRETHVHRLGGNYNRITANQPLSAHTNNRDGVAPVLDNEGGAPNYYPNTFNGPAPVAQNQPALYQFEEIVTSNFDQVAEFYQSLNETEKAGVATTIVGTFTGVTDSLITKALELFASVDDDLYTRVTTIIANATTTS